MSVFIAERTAKNVFVGVITRINYLFEKQDVPCIRVTAMDVKGVMMAGSYSAQLDAKYYCDAVKKIFEIKDIVWFLIGLLV